MGPPPQHASERPPPPTVAELSSTLGEERLDLRQSKERVGDRLVRGERVRGHESAVDARPDHVTGGNEGRVPSRETGQSRVVVRCFRNLIAISAPLVSISTPFPVARYLNAPIVPRGISVHGFLLADKVNLCLMRQPPRSSAR